MRSWALLAALTGCGRRSAIAFTGTVAPEVIDAYDSALDDAPGLGLLNNTSPDLLHSG